MISIAFDAPLNVIRNSHVRRVFFLRLGSVGDLLVATAALVETAERFPNAEIWVAGPKLWTELLLPQMWPRVTAIFVMASKDAMEGELWITNGTSGWEPMKAQQTLLEVLKNCDASVNLRPESLRYARPIAEARVAVRVGTCQWWAKHYFTHWSPWLGRDPIVHERDRLLHIVRAPIRHYWPPNLTYRNRQRLKALQTAQSPAGTKADKYQVLQAGEAQNSVAFKWRDLALPLLKEPSIDVARRLSGREIKQYVFINPTASRWEKAWPKEKFATLCARLKPRLAEQNLELMLLGAPHETQWLQDVNRLAQLKVVQPVDFHQLMDVLGHSLALITNASSLQFFANSLKVPTFVLMGRTFPARWGPLGPGDHFLCGTAPQPIPKDIFQEDYASYDSLSVEAVESAVVKWLQSHFPSQNPTLGENLR